MTEPLSFQLEQIASPVGTLLLVTDDAGRLRALHWEDGAQRMRELLQRHYRRPVALTMRQSPSQVSTALAAYFAGDLHAIDDLPVMTEGTAFQREVWAALRKIPAGSTLSYGGLAAKIGRPKAMRAVGLANNANPIGIVVPCHRVIGADCTLTGYGGGLERKRWLLDHEGAAYAG